MTLRQRIKGNLVKGLCRLHSIKPLKRQNVVILLYHRVRNENVHKPVELFEEQMAFLRNNYNIIPLDRLVDYLKNGKLTSENFAALTFDDGYRDNFEIAYPILKCLNIPATMYLTPGYLDSNESQYLTWDMVREMMNSGLIHVGNHTFGHSVLSTLSKELQEQDIRTGRQRLEEMLGIKITSFAYPLGQPVHYSQDTVDIIERDRYDFALTAFTKMIENPFTSTYEIPRIVMDGTNNLEDFEIRLSQFWSNLQWSLIPIRR